jgi:hypothetical protein
VSGELLLMAQEVARLGGVVTTPTTSPDPGLPPRTERT